MQIQKRKTRFLASVLVLGTVMGAVAGSALLSPAPQASAEGGTGSSAETTVQLNLLPVLSVAVDDFDFIGDDSIDPTESGVYKSKTNDVLVDSNAANGYKVYISTATSETALTHGNSAITKSISAVSGDVAISTYTSDTTKNNTWGYVHDDKISGIPYDSSLIGACTGLDMDDPEDVEQCYTNQRAAAAGSTSAHAEICEADESNMFDENARPECKLTIGLKADKSLPSGTYSNTVVITAVPNV